MGLISSQSFNPQSPKGLILNFREISEAINRTNFVGRAAHPQTVHNELIKDPRFVLVGRGIYGLSEHGFKPGIAREIISQILKEEGPLPLKSG